jgi:rhodanese-related sulfurtransferase
MRRKAIGLGAAIWFFICASATAGGLDTMKLFVRIRFWNVPQIGTKELATWLATDRPPLLLDVRTREEYGVSHIPGAQRVDPEADAAATLAGLPKDRPVVTYCAVGYRSAALAQRLIAAGRKDVFNLEGSIFQWANEGRPLERDGKSVSVVHPYNKTWGKLLDPQRRAQDWGRD